MIRSVVALVLLCGCQSLTDGAKEQFSSDNTCPRDRVDVRERPELKPSQFEKPLDPPAAIAADSDRVKMWREDQARLAANSDNWGQVVEVRGCGKHAFLTCGHPTKSSDGKRWSCSEQSYVPTGISKW